MVLKSWKSQGTANGKSVVEDHEILFPVVRLGSHSSRFVNVKNPSEQPVVMQLILNSGEIIDECKAADELLQPSFSSSMINYKSISPSRYGFSIAEGALTEAFVHPYGNASLGPIFFQPSNRCVWKSSVLIRNNLSGVEWLSLRGSGGSLFLVLLEDSEPAQSLEFKLGLPTHTLSSSDFLHQEEVDIDACSQQSSKELYAKNMGDLPFEVKRIGVSGSECRLDGFIVHTCKGFSLEPGESRKLKITYRTDFSVATLQRDLEFSLATGIFVIPMRASLTMHMLGFCRKSIFWTRVKRSIIAILLVSFFLILVVCCFLHHLISLGTRDYLLKSRKSSTARYVGKSSRAHCSQKFLSKFPYSAKMMNVLLRSVGEDEPLLLESLSRYTDRQTVVEEESSSAKHVKSGLDFDQQANCLLSDGKETTLASPSMERSAAVKKCDIQEATQGNLTVKTGKDKGRRRRKKKSSGTGVSGLFEVSSSHSGNSTPSSPLSPASSFTPKRSLQLSPDVDQSIQARNSLAPVAYQQHERHANSEPKSKANGMRPEIGLRPSDKKNWFWGNSTPEKSAGQNKTNNKAILLPSATFPSAGRPDPVLSCSSPFLASMSPIAPHARAPGPKLHVLGSKLQVKETVVNSEDKEVKEKFTYDIWGDHIFAPPVTGIENNSDSFFVRGPQALMSIAQSKSVSGSDQVANDKL